MTTVSDSLKKYLHQLISPYTALSLDMYAAIRMEYEITIEAAMVNYMFDIGGRSTKYKSAFKTAIGTYFGEAFKQGFEDGSGLFYPDDASMDDIAWVGAKQTAEFGYVDSLFLQLKQLKDTETQNVWYPEIKRRVQGYLRTLDGVYNEGKLRGHRDRALTFTGNDGQESCPTCMKWKGKRHRASFWINRSLIPGQPGNDAFECRGYNCQHFLIDDDGNLFMLSQYHSQHLPHWYQNDYINTYLGWAGSHFGEFGMDRHDLGYVLALRSNGRR